MNLDDVDTNPNADRAVMSIMANLASVRDAVIGYRRSLIDGGCSTATADTMAIQMHGALVERAFAPVVTPHPKDPTQ